MNYSIYQNDWHGTWKTMSQWLKKNFFSKKKKVTSLEFVENIPIYLSLLYEFFFIWNLLFLNKHMDFKYSWYILNLIRFYSCFNSIIKVKMVTPMMTLKLIGMHWILEKVSIYQLGKSMCSLNIKMKFN